MTAPNSQSIPAATSPAPPQRSGSVASILWQKAWLSLVGVLAGGLLAGLYVHFAPRVFSATSVVQIGADQPLILDLPTGARAEASSGIPESRLQEIRRTLLSPTFLARVVETNALRRDPRFSPVPEAGPSAVPVLAARLAGMLSIEIPKNDTLVSITVEHANRELVAELANSLANELILQNTRTKEEIIQSTTNRLQEILGTLQQSLRTSEKTLEPAREESLRLEARQQEISRELSDLNPRVLEATMQRISLETEQKEVQRLGTNIEALFKVPAIANSPSVSSLRTSLTQKEVAFNNLKQRYKSKHPKFIEAEQELAGLRQSLAESALTAAQGVRVSLEAAAASEAALQKRFEERSTEALKIAQDLKASTNSAATKEVDLQRSVHDRVMQRLKEATLGDLFGSPIRLIQKAEVPLRAIRPNRVQVVVGGLLGGLVVGLLVSLALGWVDSSLRSVEETEQLLGLTVLGAIPRVPSKQPKPGPLGPNDEAHFAVAEAFRSLRTSVSVIAKEKELKSFLFTSATPKEGKTLCALGYAVSLAQQGLRTLLIECDLRRPMAAVALSGIKQDSRGVSDYLKAQPTPSTFQPADPKPRSESGLSFAELRRKQHAVAEAAAASASPAPARPTERPTSSSVTLDELLQKTEIESLSFVSAGTPVPNPAELLARQGLSRLLGEALRRFDRVVIDAAPLMGISDTLLLVNQVQAICLVVRAHQTPRKAVLRTVEMLRRADAPLIGTILNDFNAAKSERYGDYYQYYGRENKPAEPEA
jgi:succinoglycan biosynthesis transport protein ExoP